MSILGDSIRADLAALEAELIALEVDNDDKADEITTLTAERDAAVTALAICEGEIEPPPPPPPTDWPTGGILITPGQNVNSIISAQPSGTTFRFSGTYSLPAKLTIKANNKYVSDTSAVQAKFTGNGPGGFAFSTADAGGVLLKGLDIANFGPANSTEGGAMVNFADGDPGTNWVIEDCKIGQTNNTGVRWGNGWTITRTLIHNAGRYALHGGGLSGTKTLNQCEFLHCGFVASDNNRGGTKFAVTKGIVVNGLWTHDIKGSGIWFDIKNESATLNDVVAEDCTRMGINFEVSYGPFTVNRPIMRRCGSDKKSSEGADWPIPGGMQCSMTPDITVNDPLVEDCRNGITIIQWQHPQVIGTIGTLDESRCGNENIIINNGRITDIDEWDAGLAGTRPAGTRPTSNIHYNNVDFDANATYRSALDIA